MGLTKEKREEMIKRILANELSYKEAAVEYDVTHDLVRRHMADYKRANGLSKPKPTKNNVLSSEYAAYEDMTKEELIRELILAKANELRAKKGYEVRGDGANKEFISLNNKNSK